jgi:ADP-ribosyl-[dinitrogen reductase] hydrolase
MSTVIANGEAAAFAPQRLLQASAPLKVVVGAHQHVVLRQDRIVERQASIVYNGRMEVKLEQQRRLEETISSARKIRAHLQHVLKAHGHEVHFRPGSTGVAMVGLLHDRPQRGRSGIKDLEAFARSYESEFEKHCRSVTQGRPTGEKALQSFLISNAFEHNGRLHAINTASTSTNEPVELTFVTDEISLPIETSKIVCDVLALRRDHGRCTPVLLELKDTRALGRLIKQVDTYAALIDEHAELFAQLFGALLGEDLRFDAPTEKWIVWPQAGERVDPREDELAAKQIRLVGYTGQPGKYAFRVGEPASERVWAGTREQTEPSTRAADERAQSERHHRAPRPDDRDRIVGCLLGGAVGDALGAAVEFSSLSAIRNAFGADGIAAYAPVYDRLGAITDDTQMTLFTAEGLLRAQMRGATRGICHPPSVVQHAYLRWLATQGVTPSAEVAQNSAADPHGWPDGWLIKQKALWNPRAPGRTCLSALSAIVALGDPAENDSKGCGTIMRVAPVGLLCSSDASGSFGAFETGVEVSRITHGHPSGYLAGGYFAQLIALLLEGHELRRAIAEACLPLRERGEDAAEVLAAIDAAVRLAEAKGEPTPERVETLGGGWVAEQALAIALYCALVARDFDHGVRLAVNHSGDSDSTGSLVGSLLGLVGGARAIPSHWLQELELREVLEMVAADLALARAGEFDFDLASNRDKYPGW